MKRELVVTADGSSSIYLPEWDEQYHSKHGAIQEAYHVFIKHGLDYFNEFCLKDSKPNLDISILEIGFGTGLNAFITMLEAEKANIHIDYCGMEAYPVSMEHVLKLNYPTALKVEHKQNLFEALHRTPWGKKHKIVKQFYLTKKQQFFSELQEKEVYHLIYFDAFGARVQPELWTEAIFEATYRALKPGGFLVTYAAKGSVRRAMQAVGFNVEKLPGPPGKREMLRALK
ncbi:tRNA (5-methylaminomethyl-2-thiouridine)(34)-methyltransferase MnmD [Mariniflexile ostreae]|uniref:tRNA (5-methylaminomethyl-2-thiouridine)(34)-methyltransferase MnmD n=1 Tax=Mariniflexile ostreae TaxID=1520892 RepID=A0ABV5FE58_9FLAO